MADVDTPYNAVEREYNLAYAWGWSLRPGLVFGHFAATKSAALGQFFRR